MRGRFYCLACLAACFVLFGLVSCTDGITPFLNRPAADPVSVKPKVVSFDVPNVINVAWDVDHCTDEFILERSVDAYPYAFEVVYRGNDTRYDDYLLGTEGTLYLYRLFKRRGERVFSTEASNDLWSIGINSSVGLDPFEPNDVPEEATSLDIDRIASSYYFHSSSGDVIQDEDWYRVRIPAHRIAQIIVTDHQPLTSGTHFKYQIPEGGVAGSAIIDVSQTVHIGIRNTGNEEREFTFRILPSPEQCRSQTSASGGMIVAYTIFVSQINQE